MNLNAPKLQAQNDSHHASLEDSNETIPGKTMSPPPFQLTANPSDGEGNRSNDAPIQFTRTESGALQLTKAPGQYTLSKRVNLRDNNAAKTVLENLPAGTQITIAQNAPQLRFGTGLITSMGQKNHYWVSVASSGREGWVKEEAIAQTQAAPQPISHHDPTPDQMADDTIDLDDEKGSEHGPTEVSPEDLIISAYRTEAQKIIDLRRAILPNGMPNPDMGRISKKMAFVPTLVKGVNLSGNGVAIVRTILKNIRSTSGFRYTGQYTSALNFLSGEREYSGDCQTLSDSVIEIFNALNIGHRISKGSWNKDDKELRVNDSKPLFNGDPCPSEGHWQFSNHYWVVVDGEEYDVLFDEQLNKSNWAEIDVPNL